MAKKVMFGDDVVETTKTAKPAKAKKAKAKKAKKAKPAKKAKGKRSGKKAAPQMVQITMPLKTAMALGLVTTTRGICFVK